MKTEALLELLKQTEQDTFTVVNEKYLQLLAEQEKLEKMKRIGAINPFAPKPAVVVPVAELKTAWSFIDSEIKYTHFKTTGTFLEKASTTPKKEDESTPKVSPGLIHLTKNRAAPLNRRAPSRKASKPLNTPAHDEIAPTQPSTDPVKVTSAPVEQAQSIPVSIIPKKDEGSSAKKEEPQPKPQSPVIQKDQSSTITPPASNKNVSAPAKTTKELTAEDLQAIVSEAVKNYTEYHTGGNKSNPLINRGQGDGFFSFLRHGAKGIATANALQKEITPKNGISMKNAALLIKDFLADSSRAYEHHSFTSYIGDALAKKGLVKPHNGKHYHKKEIVKDMEQWIENNCPSNPLQMN